VGTRYEDQPVEQWAGPESLDPTPVWKQYVLVALLFFVGLIVVVIVALTALAPMLVTPPALVFGDRLVLAASGGPPVGASPRFFGPPLVTSSQSFYLVRPPGGHIVALRAHWRATPQTAECSVVFEAGRFTCGGPPTMFDQTGEPAATLTKECGTQRCAPRALDQYLVSVSGDRVIVNLSRVIEASERTGGPVPTGIPQPQTQTP